MSALATFISDGYIEYYSCGFQNPNWITCLTGGRILPAAFMAGLLGTAKVLTTQLGIFS